MDTKYKSHSFVKLWIATTIFILCCFTTDMSAQNAAAADTVAAVTETITEVVAAPAEEASAAPDTVGELALGLNTVWMLLAAMLVFFMQPGFALVEAGFTRVKNTANILYYTGLSVSDLCSAQADSSECLTSATFLSLIMVCQPKDSSYSKPYSVRQQLQLYQEPWQNEQNSPCI